MGFIKEHPYIFWGGLSIIIIIIVVVLVLVLKSDTDDSDFDKSIIPQNVSSSSEICDDCEYIREFKVNEPVTSCSPTQVQLDSSVNCTDDLCYPGMEQLYLNCFSQEDCSSCEFYSITNNECYTDAMNKVEGDFNDRNNFIRRMYVSNSCDTFSCMPTNDQINKSGSSVKHDCLVSTYPYCEDCNFLLALRTECVDTDETDNTERLYNIGRSCGCMPTQDQINILDNIKNKGQDHKVCSQDPYCDTTMDLRNKCELSQPTTEPTTEPVVTSAPVPTTYPPVDKICSDCEFLTGMESGCVEYGLFDSEDTDESRSYYIYAACGCGPNDVHLDAVNNILANGKSVYECRTQGSCDEMNGIEC